MDKVFEALVKEGMARMRWSRKRAEQAAKRYLKRTGKQTTTKPVPRHGGSSVSAEMSVPTTRLFKARDAVARQAFGTSELLVMEAPVKQQRAKKAKPTKPRKATKPKKTKRPEMAGDLAAMPKAKRPVKKRTATALEKLERAMGPDNGRRRGGTVFLQGGSPGLGKRN